MNTAEASPAHILRELARVLGDDDSDPDALIYIFGDLERQRAEIAQLLVSLLDREHE